jgi:hypothetical protein
VSCLVKLGDMLDKIDCAKLGIRISTKSSLPTVKSKQASEVQKLINAALDLTRGAVVLAGGGPEALVSIDNNAMKLAIAEVHIEGQLLI